MELAAFMGISSSWTARRTSTSTPSDRSFYHALMIGVLAQWLMDPEAEAVGSRPDGGAPGGHHGNQVKCEARKNEAGHGIAAVG
jgi:hypothetical protein